MNLRIIGLFSRAEASSKSDGVLCSMHIHLQGLCSRQAIVRGNRNNSASLRVFHSALWWPQDTPMFETGSVNASKFPRGYPTVTGTFSFSSCRGIHHLERRVFPCRFCSNRNRICENERAQKLEKTLVRTILSPPQLLNKMLTTTVTNT